MTDDNFGEMDLPERRQVQRDWLGHIVQGLGIVIIIGIPAIGWGAATNASIATLTATLAAKTTQFERDTLELKAYQATSVARELELNAKLATIAAQLGDIRDGLKKR